MNAERNFELDRGAKSAHICDDLPAANESEPGQKGLSPEGSPDNGPATSLLLSRVTPLAVLLCPCGSTRAPSAGRFGRNSLVHGFSTTCQ